jgi:hypothetical protein
MLKLLILKMITAAKGETLELQHRARLNTESQNYTLHSGCENLKTRIEICIIHVVCERFMKIIFRNKHRYVVPDVPALYSGVTRFELCVPL